MSSRLELLGNDMPRRAYCQSEQRLGCIRRWWPTIVRVLRPLSRAGLRRVVFAPRSGEGVGGEAPEPHSQNSRMHPAFGVYTPWVADNRSRSKAPLQSGPSALCSSRKAKTPRSGEGVGGEAVARTAKIPGCTQRSAPARWPVGLTSRHVRTTRVIIIEYRSSALICITRRLDHDDG